jgi:hypothetical protein
MPQKSRDEVESLVNSRKPDLELLVNLETSFAKVEGIHCRVFLPKRMEEKLYLLLLPTREQAAPLHRPPFKLHAEVGQNILHSEEVYGFGVESTSWSTGIRTARLICEPWHFDYTTIVGDKSADSDSDHLALFVTHSELLQPAVSYFHHLDGKVDVEVVRESRFRLSSEMELEFVYEVRHEEHIDGSLAFRELVANISASNLPARIDELIDAVDDVLLLSSLAQRYRSACMGWRLDGEGRLNQHYRCNIAVPDAHQSRSQSRNDTLIDIQDFTEFLDIAHAAFREIKDKEALRRAINALLSGIESGVEDKVLVLFAGIETLVSMFRKEKGFEFVLTDEKWTELEKVLKAAIKNPTVSLTSEQRRQVYGKLRELNRIAFSDALLSFHEYYSISVSDLWPLTGRGSLAEIRNRVIHGETFTPTEISAMMTAKFQLQCHLERMLLAVLGWPSKKSRVSEHFLRIWQPYRQMKQEQEILTMSASSD